MNRRDLLKFAVGGTALGASAALGITNLPIVQWRPTPRAEAAGTTLGYPRLWNNGSKITANRAATMGRWDVWGMLGNIEANSDGTPNLPAVRADFSQLYAANPAVKILIYAEASTASNYEIYSGQQVPSDWILKDSHGNPISYLGTSLMNISTFCPVVNGQRWTDALANVMMSTFWAQGIGDGVLYDGADLWPVAQLSNPDIDMDNNGVNDFVEYGQAWVTQQWQNGFNALASTTRSLMGPNAILTDNGIAQLGTWFNGHFNEGFNWPDWQSGFDDYISGCTTHYGDNYSSLGNPEHNVGLYDYQSFRFYLTTCLMGGGLFSWYITWDQYTWFDEYSVNLSTGQATGDGSAKGYLGQPLGSYEVLGNGVYRCDYTSGIALCNPTGSAQTVNLETTYQHISGSQDPSVNNGQIVSSVTISAGNTAAGLTGDGVILLRVGSPPPNPTSTPTSGGLVAPTVNVDTCVGAGFTGDAVTVSWTNSSPSVSFVDFSTDPSFGSYWNKAVSGSTSTQLPTGFSSGAAVSPNTTYYVRIFNGSTHSPVTSFSVPGCSGGLGAPTVTIDTCVGAGFTGDAVTVSWTNGSSPVSYVDFSTDPNFGGYWNKLVLGSSSTKLPIGFSNGASVSPGTTYYVRLWNGFNHSPVTSFSVPGCANSSQAQGAAHPASVPYAPTPVPTAIPTVSAPRPAPRSTPTTIIPRPPPRPSPTAKP